MNEKITPAVAVPLRINLNDEEELQRWSHKFNVTQQELKIAVICVGNRADKVKQYLETQNPQT